jgi:VanZ family protein
LSWRFCIYGSLVPLDYRPIPASEAWSRFENIRYLNLGIASRADWVANILLFIPLAYLWLGVIWPRDVVARLVSSVAVFAGAAALSVAIEFTQIFFPPRTVSINDIAAETLGAIIGVVLWGVSGQRLWAWVSEWRTTQGAIALSGKLLYLYLFGLFVYNLLPLDLTISPVEIFHKWNEGRVILVPFTFKQQALVQIAYELLTDVLIWVPVVYLWRNAKAGRSPAQAWRWVLCAAVLLEFLQLFVYSRISDVTDVITAALGAVIGNVLVSLPPASAPHAIGAVRRPASSWVGVWLPLFMGWLGLIAVVFWYPFDVRIERAFIAERMQFLNRVPFQIYYYGTEFRAVTELLHKILFFAPGGALLAYGVCRVPSLSWRGTAGIAAVVFIAVVALFVELGQVILPGKHPDLTDWILEAAGGWIGYFGLRYVLERREGDSIPGSLHTGNYLKDKRDGDALRGSGATDMRPASGQASTGKTWRRSLSASIVGALLGVAALAVLFLAIRNFPGTPYNVRKVLGGEYPFLGPLALSATLWLTLAVPAWWGRRASTNARVALLLYAFLLGVAVISWFMLSAVVPSASIEKIVGSPILGWPNSLETALRFVALHSALGMQLSGAALAVAVFFNPRALGKFVIWAILAIVASPVLHAVIVTHAATDNLTELMRNGGQFPSTTYMALALILSAAAGSLLSLSLARKRHFVFTAVFVIAAGIGSFLLLGVATESSIIKYGKIFSALQFALSANRESYLPEDMILLRYCVAYAGFAGVTAMCQYAQWRALVSAPKDERSHKV